jgi:hypothetical protein
MARVKVLYKFEGQNRTIVIKGKASTLWSELGVSLYVCEG